MGTSLNLLAIQTKSGFYISDKTEHSSYYSSVLGNLLFDGYPAEKTYDSFWFKIPKEPIIVQRKLQDKIVNRRWELKAGYPKSSLTPEVITVDPGDEESEFYDVRNLYLLKYDTEPGGFETLDIKMTIIAEEDDFQIKKQEFKVEYGILDRITVNPILLPIKPCFIDSETLYRIVREHIRKNINGHSAKITSDYDFCFTVRKSMKLAEPAPYLVDIGTKRKPNLTTRYNTEKMVEVFQMAPKPYQNYTVIEPLKGHNYDDLQNKLAEYLNHLMEVINEPIKECSCCKGSGIDRELTKSLTKVSG